MITFSNGQMVEYAEEEMVKQSKRDRKRAKRGITAATSSDQPENHTL